MFEDVPWCFGGQPWRHIAPGMHGKLGDGIVITRAVVLRITLATHHWKAYDERISVVPRHGSYDEVERKL